MKKQRKFLLLLKKNKKQRINFMCERHTHTHERPQNLHGGLASCFVRINYHKILLKKYHCSAKLIIFFRFNKRKKKTLELSEVLN